MNQFDVLSTQVHAETHMNTHISLQRQVLLPDNAVLALLQHTLGTGSHLRGKGLVAFALEQLLGFHRQLCKPGSSTTAPASARSWLVGPRGQWHCGAGGTVGPVEGLCCGCVPTRAQAACSNGGKGVPRVAQHQCLQLSEKQQKLSV